MAATFIDDSNHMPLVLQIVGALMITIALLFQFLKVRDSGEKLVIQFGPLPLFRKRIAYDDIQSVAVGRTVLLEGWGIHYSPRGGWVWNIWGRDCVVITRRQGVIRVGTNDADHLAAFLESKLSTTQSLARSD